MKYELIGKLVNPITEKVVGYKISVGTPYTAVVTKDYAQQIGVDDIDGTLFFGWKLLILLFD